MRRPHNGRNSLRAKHLVMHFAQALCISTVAPVAFTCSMAQAKLASTLYLLTVRRTAPPGFRDAHEIDTSIPQQRRDNGLDGSYHAAYGRALHLGQQLSSKCIILGRGSNLCPIRLFSKVYSSPNRVDALADSLLPR